MNSFINSIDNIYIMPLIALIGGLITSLTPCSLSSIPLVISYVSNGKVKNSKEGFIYSLFFAFGNGVIFSILGVLSSVLGIILNSFGKFGYIILGILITLMSFQNLGVIQIIKPTYLVSKNKKRGYFGAFIAGVLGGLFSLPCATPILVTLLSAVSISSNIFVGFITLLFYSIGNSLLVILIGTFTGKLNKLILNEKYGKFTKYLNYFISFVLFSFALYLFYLGF